MPLQNIEPEIVELNEFPGGFKPDPDPALVPATALLDANNLLPDEAGSGGLVVRPGFKRFGTFVLDGYKVVKVHSFNVVYGKIALGKRFLIATASMGGSEVANNLQIIVINLDDGTWSRIDDVGRPWIRSGGGHFGVTVDNVFYGGGERDPVYAYRPYYSNGVATSASVAWDPDATMPQRSSLTWTSGNVYAVHDRVEDGGYVWVCHLAHTAGTDKRPKNGINSEDYWTRLATRFNDWVDGTSYEVGDKVMVSVAGNNKYPRGLAGRTTNIHSAFIATRAHTANINNKPPSWAWDPFRAPVSNLGLYHGSRLFMRESDTGTSRARYSGRVKADGLFNPADWESTDVQGPGFMDIRTGDGDDITAYAELGDMLFIFKRHSTHVLTGLNPSTWRIRQVAPVGALTRDGVTELNGLIYFMSTEGLMQSDGALVQPVPGADAVNKYIRENIEWVEDEGGGIEKQASFTAKAFRDQVFFCIPTQSGSAVTLVYDPILQSFWPLDFATHKLVVGPVDGVDQLFMAALASPALVLQYDHPDAGDQDDTQALVYAARDIPWRLRTGWLSFGTANEDRKLRRTWARIRATSKTVTLKAYKNLSDTVVWTVNTLLGGPTGTVEGKKIDNAQAVSFRVEGTSAPAKIHGLAVHTQFRRKRYHRA